MLRAYLPGAGSGYCEPALPLYDQEWERFAGKKSVPGEMQSAADFIGLAPHTPTITHIDSLAHVFRNGQMYNGHSADKVTTSEGATVESVDLLRNGIVTRGVLLDIPRLKRVKWLDHKEGIFPEDLAAVEQACGVQVTSGDVLLVRTGATRRRREEGPIDLLARGWPGLHAACLPWLHQRQVAVLGTDTGTDVSPSGHTNPHMPIHEVGMVAMGLWIMDNANFEELAEACERHQRWEFLLMIGPLRLVRGTGSPVNPIAVF